MTNQLNELVVCVCVCVWVCVCVCVCDLGPSGDTCESVNKELNVLFTQHFPISERELLLGRFTRSARLSWLRSNT